MSPTKRDSLSYETTSGILHEIIAIRNTIQLAQQSLNRLERALSNKRRSSSHVNEEQNSSPRMMLHEMAIPARNNTICWYHRRHGDKTDPRNCPGLPTCSFITKPSVNDPAIFTRPKKPRVIPKPSTIAISRVMTRPKKPGMIPKPATVTQVVTPVEPVEPVKPVSSDQPPGINLMDWTSQSKNPEEVEKELENELLDVSD